METLNLKSGNGTDTEYKLIKKYPGSPELGAITTERMVDWPEYWEAQVPAEILYSEDLGLFRNKHIVHSIIFTEDNVTFSKGDLVASMVHRPFPIDHIEIIKANPDWAMVADRPRERDGSIQTCGFMERHDSLVKIDNTMHPRTIESLVKPSKRTGHAPVYYYEDLMRENGISRVMHEETYHSLMAMVAEYRNRRF